MLDDEFPLNMFYESLQEEGGDVSSRRGGCRAPTPQALRSRSSPATTTRARTPPSSRRSPPPTTAGRRPTGTTPGRRACATACASCFGDVEAFPVFNGTGGNVTVLAAVLRPYEAVICPETAHINVDECGAPERIAGAKLVDVPTPDGKLTPELLRPRLVGFGDQHHVQARVVSISQSTELGHRVHAGRDRGAGRDGARGRAAAARGRRPAGQRRRGAGARSCASSPPTAASTC